MKCSTGNLMDEHHYSFLWFVATDALNKRKLIVSVAAFHRFVARIRSLNGVEGVRSSTLQDSLLNKSFQLPPLGVLVSRRTWKRLATKVWTTKNLPRMQLVRSITVSWLGFSSYISPEFQNYVQVMYRLIPGTDKKYFELQYTIFITLREIFPCLLLQR